MSRRRYISTDISVDRKVNDLATQYGDFAALLYTWMIPHASDQATIIAEPGALLALVTPRLRHKTEEDVTAAIEGMVAVKLVKKHKKTLYINTSGFYRYQTYIKPEKRRSDGANSEEQRETPQNAVYFTLPSKDLKDCASEPDAPKTARSPYTLAFEEWWKAYPLGRGKAMAFTAWKKACKIIDADVLLTALKSYRWQIVGGEQVIPHASTWLNQCRWEDTPAVKSNDLAGF